MNEIVKKFLLAGGQFMPEMHLRKPGFTYYACGPFTKNKERFKMYLSKRIRLSLLSTLNGLWRF